MKATVFDELACSRLIGRQALIALGMPVMTADYDFWLAADDIGVFNDARDQR